MTAPIPTPPEGIQYAPSPWRHMPVQTFILPFWTSSPILDDAYAPLEAASAFANPGDSGAFKGGLGMMQIVRYHDTPVGPYDELLLVPGYFYAPQRGKTMVRCTRIYVSQKGTCWNGRFNWNIPKHLARFNFTSDTQTGALTVEVYSPGEGDMTDLKPFFRATLTPTKWLPSFPFSTGISKYVGMSTELGQPPLPAAVGTPREEVNDTSRQLQGSSQPAAGTEDAEILCGTEEWRYVAPLIWGGAKMCWPTVDDSDGVDRTGWWPSYRPWKMGLWIEDGFVNFQDANSPSLSGR